MDKSLPIIIIDIVHALLDRVYSLCDAEGDEEIQRFRNQISEELNQYQDQLCQTDQLVL